VRTSSFSNPSSRYGLAALAAVLLNFPGVIGCYNPTLKGTFKCNPEYDKAYQCPSGTTCMAGFCVKNGTTLDGGVDKQVDAKVDVSVDMSTPDAKVDASADGPPIDTAPMCITPVEGCTPDTTKMCDPACQTGCGCQQKCSVNTKGTLTCNAPAAGRPRGLLEACEPLFPGALNQTDICAPGLVCLADGCGARCYQFCKADKDCPSSVCSKDAGGGQKVCDVPNATCDPVKAGGADGCGSSMDTLVCYVSSTVKDRTFCDCPFEAGAANSPCTLSRDCFAGLACVASQCRQVCNLTKGSTDCAPGQTCYKLNGSDKYGYCNL
jgi:hypothetical protein